MPEDKRPRPAIDMTAEHVQQPPRPALPGGRGAEGASQKSAGGAVPREARPKRHGILGYLLAGLAGGAIAASGAYIASTQDIPGFSLTDPGTQRRIKELEERAASLEGALRAMAARPAAADAYQAPVAAERGLNEVRSRLDGLADAARGFDQTLLSLSQRIQALEQQPQGEGQAREAAHAEIASQTAAMQQRLASAERALEGLTRAQSERQADARTASLTLALTNLKRAISDGRPFPAELAAVETLSPAKLPVSQLGTYKDTGIATLAQLQYEFAGISKKTVEAHYGSKSSGFMGEVLSRAKSAIQITPADSAGDSVEAILGRMSAALKSGDLKGALVQGASLQSPPQEMMDWFRKAQARVAADEALRKTDQELLASLTRGSGRRQ